MSLQLSDWTELNLSLFKYIVPLLCECGSAGNLPAMHETWVWSWGWENRLDKGEATYSNILVWRIPWISARRSNQSILKEISPECSAEGLMLKLKLQYFGHLLWRTDSLEKILMLGKAYGTQSTWVWVNSGSW